ncbi:MAG: T9SS C-terminal target domain-containing protein [Saprospiraceae bacterium]|nr:T9SS C-terminal target domain-containing protein [Saprospiraceae bacterium]
MIRWSTIFALLLFATLSFSQSPFPEISLSDVSVDNLGGIQSYAFGQHNGKWLILGGRLDGLHRRQPWASFDPQGNNTQIIVVDPQARNTWKASVESLPLSLKDQLSSTNMEFYQEDENLYIIGGYGYSEMAEDHITYPFLAAINVPSLIEAVINGQDLLPSFQQIQDPQFQVTGGRLEKIYDTYYLVGGQKFMGRYNPMGPDHGPGFIQEYTNQIRKFRIQNDGDNLSVTFLPAFTDEDQLHRRDYNVVPQVLQNGEEGLTAFSGVFQHTVDLPFLNSVNIDSSGYSVNEGFLQYYNHYHCPVVPLYSSTDNEMHNIFFGGIAQFYDDNGVMVQDNDVPFVNTIARVSRNATGEMTESKLPVELPELIGAGAEFIPNPDITTFSNGVIDLDALPEEKILLGYIFGGIKSSQPNIFWINDGTQSQAERRIFELYLENGDPNSTIETSNSDKLKPVVYPNPTWGNVYIHFHLADAKPVEIDFRSINGQMILAKQFDGLPVGDNWIEVSFPNIEMSGAVFCTIRAGDESRTVKVLLVE